MPCSLSIFSTLWGEHLMMIRASDDDKGYHFLPGCIAAWTYFSQWASPHTASCTALSPPGPLNCNSSIFTYVAHNDHKNAPLTMAEWVPAHCVGNKLKIWGSHYLSDLRLFIAFKCKVVYCLFLESVCKMGRYWRVKIDALQLSCCCVKTVAQTSIQFEEHSCCSTT